MKDALMQGEVFVFLAMVLLIGVYLLELERIVTPPILVLSEETEEFRFSSGSDTLTHQFRRALRTSIVPLLDSLQDSCQCDLIEVVGHTDAEPIRRGQRSNLDRSLLAVYHGADSVGVMAGSNVDLGMLRALSVVGALKRIKDRTGLLEGVERFVPYSVGQVVLPDGTISQADSDPPRDAARRRIEIRLRRVRSLLTRPPN